MGLFRSKPPIESAESDSPLRPPWSLWADPFGRLAIRALQVIVVVAVTAGIIIVIRELTIVTIPLVLALIVASALAPVMSWMRRRGLPSIAATLISMFGIIAILGGVGWLIVWAVRDQWDELFESAQEGFRTFAAWAQDLPFFPSAAELDDLLEQAIDFVTSAQFGSGALAGLGAVANFLAGAVLFIVILFFFLKDGPQMWEFLLRPFRGEQYRRAQRIGGKTVTVLGSYVRGTAAVALVDAVGTSLGGILGAILAVPITAAVWGVVQVWDGPDLPARWARPRRIPRT